MSVADHGSARRVYASAVPAPRRAWLEALRDPHALRILRLIQAGPRGAPGLSLELGLSHKVVWRRLGRLERAGLVARRLAPGPVFHGTASADAALGLAAADAGALVATDAAGLASLGAQMGPAVPEPAE